MPARVHASLRCATLLGASALPIDVQVDLALGLPGFFVVGLPDMACLDAKVRCATAIRNSGYELPHKRITVNLAPGDLRKEGASFDLPISLAVLQAAGLIPPATVPTLALGELSLSGEILPVRGVLPIALLARGIGVRRMIVPEANAAEASLAQDLEVHGVRALPEAAAAFTGELAFPPGAPGANALPDEARADLSEVRGQAFCKRALEIAAAGAHSALLVGPPGAGKTMLARRMPGLLPALTFEEAVETTSIWSVAGRLRHGQGLLSERPFRAPHHTISVAGLVGGGSPPRPGEVSLAHNGLLFLDELPEFGRAALEALRQPLEDGEVAVVRLRGAALLPARFMLLAAMNPCPCGHEGETATPARCNCTVLQKEGYRRRVSGPILDRFDLHVEARALSPSELSGPPSGETSDAVRARVEAARARQRERFRGLRGVHANSQLRGRALRELGGASSEAAALLARSMERLGLSARAHDRILKLARTIADLENARGVEAPHVAEAVQLRCLDRPVTGRSAEKVPTHQLARAAVLRANAPGALPGPVTQEGT
jgi:magnesium chelatase family protein